MNRIKRSKEQDVNEDEERKDESDIAFKYLHTSSHDENEQHNQLKFT